MTDHQIQVAMVWITGGGIVVGIGVLLVYVYQLKEMRRQVSLTERQMSLSNYAHLDMRNWTTEVEMGAMLPKRIFVKCDIANTGNIPATIRLIETTRDWNGFVTAIAADATVYPSAEPYPFCETIECADLDFRGTERAGGALRGKVLYSHAFDRRIKNFSMLVWVNTRGQSGIERAEGAGNNDEPDNQPN